jgi:hypothetical protein
MTQSMPMPRGSYSGGIRSFLPGRADRKPFLFHRRSSLGGLASGACIADEEGCGTVREEPDDSLTVAIDAGAAAVHNPFIEPRANLAKPRRDRLTIVLSPSRGIAPVFRKWKEQDGPARPTWVLFPARAALRQRATRGFFGEHRLRCSR